MQWFNHIFNKSSKASQPAGKMLIPPSKVEELIKVLEMTREVELSCDELHKLMGEFAEVSLRDEDAEHLLPLVNHHLKLCPNCREEYEALVRILRAHIE
jgi:hypothetical protein